MNLEGKGQPIFAIRTKKTIPPDLEIIDETCPFCKKVLANLSSAKKHIASQCCQKDKNETIVYSSLEEKDVDENTFYEIQVEKNEYVQIIPQNTQRSTFLITGQSGSGKSYFAAQVIREFHKKHKKRKIYLFSALPSDPTLDKSGLPIKRIKLDETFLNTSIDMKEFQDTILIFDDVDVISNKKIKEKVFRIIDGIAQIGRHFNSTILICNHAPNRGKETKIILLESQYFVIFPKTSGSKTIKYLMENYVGLNTKQIARLKMLPSRWVCLVRQFPQLVVYEKGAYVLNV